MFAIKVKWISSNFKIEKFYEVNFLLLFILFLFFYAIYIILIFLFQFYFNFRTPSIPERYLSLACFFEKGATMTAGKKSDARGVVTRFERREVVTFWSCLSNLSKTRKKLSSVKRQETLNYFKNYFIIWQLTKVRIFLAIIHQYYNKERFHKQDIKIF